LDEVSEKLDPDSETEPQPPLEKVPAQFTFTDVKGKVVSSGVMIWNAIMKSLYQ
jgi:hypothetical protein